MVGKGGSEERHISPHFVCGYGRESGCDVGQVVTVKEVIA